jgi:hypothetical protein
MKKILCITLIALTSLTTFAADESSDFKSLQGIWIPVKAELGGEPLPDAVLKTTPSSSPITNMKSPLAVNNPTSEPGLSTLRPNQKA